MGDRFIDVLRAIRRSTRRNQIEQTLYTVGHVRLTPGQVDSLEAIVRLSGGRMRDIAEELGVDPSTASRTLSPLVDLGLIEREVDPDDRRQVLVVPTPIGIETCEHIDVERKRMMRKVLQAMEPRKRVLLTELLEEYLRLQEATGTLLEHA